MTDPEILALPACRAMAEEMAGEWAEELAKYLLVTGCVKNPDWAHDFAPRETWTAGAFARLLADLSRPASRDAWVRWLAEQQHLENRRYAHWHAIRNSPAALKAAILEVPRG